MKTPKSQTRYRTTYSRNGKMHAEETKTLGPRHEELRRRAEVEGQFAETESMTWTEGAMFVHCHSVARVGASPSIRAMNTRHALESWASSSRSKARELLERLMLLLHQDEVAEAKATAAEASGLFALAADLCQIAKDVRAEDCMSPMKGDFYAAPVEAEGGAR